MVPCSNDFVFQVIRRPASYQVIFRHFRVASRNVVDRCGRLYGTVCVFAEHIDLYEEFPVVADMDAQFLDRRACFVQFAVIRFKDYFHWDRCFEFGEVRGGQEFSLVFGFCLF